MRKLSTCTAAGKSGLLYASSRNSAALCRGGIRSAIADESYRLGTKLPCFKNTVNPGGIGFDGTISAVMTGSNISHRLKRANNHMPLPRFMDRAERPLTQPVQHIRQPRFKLQLRQCDIPIRVTLAWPATASAPPAKNILKSLLRRGHLHIPGLFRRNRRFADFSSRL